jgi:hypothetical protein
VSAKDYDGLSAVVFLVGIYAGVVPFVVRLFSADAQPLLALPLRLDGPWWWIASATAIVAAVALLEALDRAKRRAAR